MGADTLDLIIEQGATFEKILTLYDSAGVLRDLTGYTGRMMARTTIDAVSTVISLTSPTDIVISGGTITINIDAATTAAYTFTTLVYDLEIEKASKVTRVVQGSITLSKEVTR